MTGATFCRWTVLAKATNGPNAKWHCRCACGTQRAVCGNNLRSGISKSCGCLRREASKRRRTTHGHCQDGRRSPEYRVWLNMLNRVRNPDADDYHHYGGRGVTIDPAWENFENFLSDMGSRPVGTSIDRIDNDGPYAKYNCRWASRRIQHRNMRTNVMVRTSAGLIVATDAANQAGLRPKTVHVRIRAGWDERDLLIPSGAKRKFAKHRPGEHQ
jgi:hypothetical protein